ncbi:MAG: exodeoxyribonuclease VII large subunit [Pseudomonadota bacterium]
MMDNPPAAGNEPGLAEYEYSVSELALALKRTVEEAFGRVRVRGEISGFKRAASGHLYFALKDEKAVLDAVCWRGTRLGAEPADGLEVICTGRLTTYPGRSRYQIVVEEMEFAGEGALLKLLEERRKKLAAEGLFDPAKKKPLPYLPERIGVITSPTGAVLRDILHRLNDRFPRPVLLWPVAVQGEGAASAIAAAIEGFNQLPKKGAIPRPDLLIVARGGGSLEDLWAFNEESVVRAAAASKIPLISAVGHETDTTLIDFAADRRAPTPSAAAEMAVPVRAELIEYVLDCTRRLGGATARRLETQRAHLKALARGLVDPKSFLEMAALRLDEWTDRLKNAMEKALISRTAHLAGLGRGLPHPGERLLKIESELAFAGHRLKAAGREGLNARAQRLAEQGRLLESLSYTRVLKRGFALVRDTAGEPITSVRQTTPGLVVGIRFGDGEVGAAIERTPSKKRPRKTEQGDLF